MDSQRPNPAMMATAGGPTIDPVRILRTYWPFLAVAGVVGLGLGYGVYQALMRLAPEFRSTVQYQVLPPQRVDATVDQAVGQGGGQELENYILTQAFVITSDLILSRAVQEPRIRDETQWARQFVVNGTYDVRAAARGLRQVVRSRPLRDTSIIELSATASRPADAQRLAESVSDVYLRDNLQRSTRSAQDKLEDYEAPVRQLQRDIESLDVRLANMLDENQLTGMNERSTVYFAEIQTIQPQLVDVRQGIASLLETRDQFQEVLDAPGGTVYPESIRAQAEAGPIPSRLEGEIETLEAFLNAQREQYGDNHRVVQSQVRQLRALREQREKVIQREMGEAFDTQVEAIDNQIDNLRATEQELMTRLETARASLNEVTQTLAQHANLEQTRLRKMQEMERLELLIAELEVVNDMGSRVQVLQTAQIPDTRSFPRLIPTVGAVAVLLTGLVGSLIFLKELREQRVRSAQDIAALGRTRVLGVVPEASIDPANPERVETAIVDRPTGAVAESIRQIRTILLKAIRQREHKSVLFLSGLPGSGSSAMVSNLAANAAAVELAVLVVDANVRRPSMHETFGVAEGPGLAEVLSRRATLDEAVGPGNVPGVSVLSAGLDREHAYEKFTTPRMTELLDEAGRRFDLVLIDAPPAIVSGDAMALTAHADAAVLVVRAYREKRGLVARLRNQLVESPSEFLGVIVNAVRPSAGGYLKRNAQATIAYQRPTNGGGGGGGASPAEREAATGRST